MLLGRGLRGALPIREELGFCIPGGSLLFFFFSLLLCCLLGVIWVRSGAFCETRCWPDGIYET